ncbi:sigma-70 RNA polymerase sigma factor region 4 domain-containing protein [Nocardia heshunensis]
MTTKWGLAPHLASLVPLIIDGAITQATIALPVLARSPRSDNTPGNEVVRTDYDPVRTADTVRTTSVREIHTETRSTATELRPGLVMSEIGSGEPVALEAAGAQDRWATIAESVCHADPAGRRDPDKVATILRLKFEDNWSHSRIAEHVELSSSAVTRTLTAARNHIDGAEGGTLQWTE